MDPFSVPLQSIGNQMLSCQFAGIDRRWKLGGSGNEESPSCPRCASPNTKFCYYNNYSLTQPRYFCKSCRRYWTKGGSLRNVPVGGGCRKSRRSRAARAARANPFPAAHPNSNNRSAASTSSDDVDHDEQDRVHDIDMAAVFAKFLNQDSSPNSEIDQLNCADQESPSDEVDPSFALPINVIDPLMFLSQDTAGQGKQQIQGDGEVQEFMAGNDLDLLGLTPSMLAEGDLDGSMLAAGGGLWIDPESLSFPNSTWQHETLSSSSADHDWKIGSSSTNLMMMTGDNWNSTFDFPGFEVL
ncbi:dof zinc finger protein DOF3.5 [Punica granatum]|uniref:Dof zinc finger protein n=2 Tax=Punica granatum TaxID=22663 RepID=A0A218XIM9_PUNGR|nr:dof zinc finger protein DOF3.5 [Punica granatum]OWM85065.1 hypothetical protein CDL15_Pgr027852 [Punica granatum]PKI57464.1 hypothetical protein CRG98_022115 [Punica granatum]